MKGSIGASFEWCMLQAGQVVYKAQIVTRSKVNKQPNRNCQTILKNEMKSRNIVILEKWDIIDGNSMVVKDYITL